MVIVLYALRKRVFQILQPSTFGDSMSRSIDVFLIALILLNVGIVFAHTFSLPSPLLPFLRTIETLSIFIFSLEYGLRVWTADFLYPDYTPGSARLRYIVSWMALIDLLSILPFYLPMLIPFDLKVLRSIRLLRLFQIFKLTRYTSSLISILRVMQKKSSQLLSSMAVVLILIVISSLLMYNVENPAQPEVFTNAFSGMWWAISTLTTVGYGDIYPITPLGKLIGSVIALLGIVLLAIPTAIISSGFIEFNNAKHHEEQDTRTHYCPHCGKKLP